MWSASTDSGRPILWFWNHRNVLSSFLNNFSLPYLMLFFTNINLAFWSLFFIRIFRGEPRHSFTLLEAYLWHIRNLEKTLKNRKKIQEKVRKVPDNEIFKKTMLNPSWKYYLIHFKMPFTEDKLPSHLYYKGPLRNGL
jgi:hypothetical protein